MVRKSPRISLQRGAEVLSRVTAGMRVDPRDLMQRVLGTVHRGTPGSIFLTTTLRNLIIICIISVIFFLNYPHRSTNQYSPAPPIHHSPSQPAERSKTVTFTPTVIPPSAPELGNPWRGPQYYSSEVPPPNWPL